jgi:TolA-binding protein
VDTAEKFMQKRVWVTLLLAILALPLALQAAEGDYWQQLKERLAQIAPQKKGSATTAVGGVRGSKEQAADTLYWKDEAVIVQVPEEEYARFAAAQQSVADGKNELAMSGFQSFVDDYPQSALKAEALAAIDVLQKP